MNINLTELLEFFDELLPHTKVDLGQYWFKSFCKNELSVHFTISIYESKCIISIYSGLENAIASLYLTNCTEIRVLDAKRKCLEVIHSSAKGRCFISLHEGPILTYKET